jgi:hypothetical protein
MSMLSKFAKTRFARRFVLPALGEYILSEAEGSVYKRAKSNEELAMAEGIFSELRRQLRESLTK